MHQLKISLFMDMQDMLVQWSIVARTVKDRRVVTEGNRKRFAEAVRPLIAEMKGPDFHLCRRAAQSLLDHLEGDATGTQLLADIDHLRSCLLGQMEGLSCLALTDEERALFDPAAPLFGPDVEAKFANMSEDIAEAGKCLALQRPTAAVFHLMRVMELALRKLGDVLGVPLVEDKNWQAVLDGVNKAIKALDHKQKRTKDLASAASHLYAVKVAWRNEVMHPKQTYTPEQAKAIFDGVRVFVADLAALL